MPSQPPPSFDEWIDYCFTQGATDFHGESGDDEDLADERYQRFITIEPPVITQYLIKLFESPSFAISRYSDEQIADATRFIFGVGSWYIPTVRYDVELEDLQVRCIRSIATMYTDFFDKVCGKRGNAPDEQYDSRSPVDSAVEQVWGMDCLEGMLMFPQKAPHLVAPGLHVLQTILHCCRTAACRRSALYGIGTIYFMQRGWRGDKAIKHALQSMVDEFLQRTDVPDWLRDFALAARKGSPW